MERRGNEFQSIVNHPKFINPPRGKHRLKTPGKTKLRMFRMLRVELKVLFGGHVAHGACVTQRLGLHDLLHVGVLAILVGVEQHGEVCANGETT